MNEPISPHLIRTLLQQGAELGATCALVKAGKLKPYLKRNEAFRLYGRKNIERWMDEGLITLRKDGSHSSTWRINRLELELIVKARFILQHL
jgi:hypothetical protein